MILGAIALLILALALIAAELFVPSHGMLAILSVLAAIASIILAAKASAMLALIFAVIVFIAAPFVFYWAVRLYPRTPMGRRVMLPEPPADAGQGFADETARLAELVGQHGFALTTLRPAGSVEIAGRRINALSESEVIDAGCPVEVARVSGLKVFVKAMPTN